MATSTISRKTGGTTPLYSRTLREEVSGYDALPAGGYRVDRTKKIVYGMKMVGLSSPNTHNVPGAKGTDYELAALRESKDLYEGAQAFMDHPEKRDATAERKGRDSLGIWHNVRVTSDGTFGDLHLVPSHEMTESILDVAEHDTLEGVYMASHNADGQGDLDPTTKRYKVKKITEVRSVDIVTRGATTRNFRESREGRSMTKKPLKTIVMESKLPAKLKAKLLEMDVMDNEAEDGSGDAWKDHLVNAVGVLVKSDDPEDHKKAKAILKQLEPQAELEESDDEPDEKREPEKDKDKKDEKAAIEESRELFTMAGIKPSQRLLESVAKMPRLADRMIFINEMKGAGVTGTDKNKPPPGAPRTGGNAALLEGQEKKTYADLQKVSLT